MVFPLLDINVQYKDAMQCAHVGPLHPFKLNNSALSLHSHNIQTLTSPVPTNIIINKYGHLSIKQYKTFIFFLQSAYRPIYPQLAHSFMYSRWKQPQKRIRGAGSRQGSPCKSFPTSVIWHIWQDYVQNYAQEIISSQNGDPEFPTEKYGDFMTQMSWIVSFKIRQMTFCWQIFSKTNERTNQGTNYSMQSMFKCVCVCVCVCWTSNKYCTFQ